LKKIERDDADLKIFYFLRDRQNTTQFNNNYHARFVVRTRRPNHPKTTVVVVYVVLVAKSHRRSRGGDIVIIN